MDLLERYLADIRRNLPAREADDIIAELRDLLLARAEEQEEKTGSVDWVALLRDFGHPLVIAARYRKQQWLIGPELYPFYLHFLKAIVGIVLIVVTALAAIRLAIWGPDPGAAVVGWLGSLWWSAASTVGWVTIVFVAIERFGGGAAEKCRHWKPSELPDVVDRQPSRANSIFEVAMGILFLSWWIGMIRIPQLSSHGFWLNAAPIWDELFWPVTALLAARLAYNLVVWIRPRWKFLRGLLGVTTAVGAIMIAAFASRAGSWITVVSTGLALEQTAALQASLDLAFRIALVVVIVVWSIGIAAWLWRRARGAWDRVPATA